MPRPPARMRALVSIQMGQLMHESTTPPREGNLTMWSCLVTLKWSLRQRKCLALCNVDWTGRLSPVPILFAESLDDHYNWPPLDVGPAEENCETHYRAASLSLSDEHS